MNDIRLIFHQIHTKLDMFMAAPSTVSGHCFEDLVQFAVKRWHGARSRPWRCS